MKSDLRTWLFSLGASAAAHAATFGAMTLLVKGPWLAAPGIALPTGEGSGILIEVDSVDEALPVTTPPASHGARHQDAVATAAPGAGDQERSAGDVLGAMLGREAELRDAEAGLEQLLSDMVVAAGASTKVFEGDPEPAASDGQPNTSGGDPGVFAGPVPAPGNRPPVYPPEARRRRQSGTVLVHLLIEADGRVSKATITSSSGFPLLDRAALKAVTSWRFSPATSGGIAIRCEADLPVEFVLRIEPAPAPPPPH